MKLPGTQDNNAETSIRHDYKVVGGVERFAAEIVFSDEACAAGTFDEDATE